MIRDPSANDSGHDPIAIIGAAGRFPQSKDLDEFWRNLIEGRDCVTEIPAERWNWRDYQSRGPDGTPVARWGGFMPDIDNFDAEFFGIPPRDAALMDPQHRIFMETVWAALEDAGYCPSLLGGRAIGVFAGAQLNEYKQLIGDRTNGNARAAIGNAHTMLANRVSGWFNFLGPSQTIDTACSSALVAVHRAVQALRNGDCEMAIAGGVSTILSAETYILSQHLGMLSPDGRCKTFDKNANGYVKGEGVGAVLLKPFRDALADGDNILAVIVATAENHGGRSNFMTAPNPAAQAELIRSAHAGAGIDPRTISYVEAHGTGMELGDPIEVDALKRAFRERAEEMGKSLPDRPFCGLATVKSNVGHLEPAAGIAGVLKVVMALQHRQLPPTLHVRDVNPYLHLEGSPFYLVTSAEPWEPVDDNGNSMSRRAAISAFGFGGSNAHAVVQEFLRPEPAASSREPMLVPLSARDEDRLRQAAANLCAFLRVATPDWGGLVHTLQAGRETMKESLVVEASSPEELLTKLATWQSGGAPSGVFRGSEAAKRMAAVSSASGAAPRRISLPTYPFARTRHWFDAERPATPAPSAAHDDIKKILAQLVADALYLEPGQIDDEIGFSELGLDSILAVELVKRINDRLGVDLRAARLYDCSNLRQLADLLTEPTTRDVPATPAVSEVGSRVLLRTLPGNPPAAAAVGAPASAIEEGMPLMELGRDRTGAAPVMAPFPALPTDIAIIGMAGRFPGARTPDEFWNHLANGDDLLSDIPVERWPAQHRDDPQLLASLRCRRGGFIDDVDKFDPLFFNISPREAEAMDPQHRLFLEEGWNAIEDAGYSDTSLSNRKCAVFVGAGGGDYFMHSAGNLSGQSAQFGMGNVPSILAARLSYLLNLRGPAVALDTACSSSLVAIHLACQSMWNGESEMALAGGVSLMTTPQTHVFTGDSGMLSASGVCRTFDDAADGFVPAEGVGAVVLKPLAAAMEDGDRIYGVIRGSGINQDGRTNGITAPSAAAQTALELSIYERFGIDPDTISYVEAHGTGTKMGDPIEIEGLTDAMRRHTARRGFCAIGSVKTNMGHALAASGMAGLIKVLLMFRHGKIPASLRCERENGQIDFSGSPFFVCKDLMEWPAMPGRPRRAAISSFGFSGTNAHLVLEAAPPVGHPPPPAATKRLFAVSAKTPAALARRLADHDAWLEGRGAAHSLDDISFTLNVGRSHFRRRAAFVASNREDLRTKLRAALAGDAPQSTDATGPLERVAQSYLGGGAVDWSISNPSGSGRRISLPTYPFEAKRYWIRPAEQAPIDELLSCVGKDLGGPASFWIPSVMGEIHWIARLSHDLGDRLAFYAFQRKSTQHERYESLEEVAAAYVAALRQVRPHGPYVLGGYSYGGVVAYEMARQLSESGEKISHLVLLDTYAPDSQLLTWLLSVPWGDFVLVNIANLLTAQWKGKADLDVSLFEDKDEQAQAEIAARQLKARCNLPQSESELAGFLRDTLRMVQLERRLVGNYRAQQYTGEMRVILFRSAGGFTGQSDELQVPEQFRGAEERDHGWTAWLPAPPHVVEIAADHFTIAREPALSEVSRQLAGFLTIETKTHYA